MKKWLSTLILAGFVTVAHAGDAPFTEIPEVINDTATGDQVEVIGNIAKTLSPHHFMLKEKTDRLEIIVPKAVPGSDKLRPGIRANVVGKVARSDGKAHLTVSKVVTINGARPDMMTPHESRVFKTH